MYTKTWAVPRPVWNHNQTTFHDDVVIDNFMLSVVSSSVDGDVSQKLTVVDFDELFLGETGFFGLISLFEDEFCARQVVRRQRCHEPERHQSIYVYAAGVMQIDGWPAIDGRVSEGKFATVNPVHARTVIDYIAAHRTIPAPAKNENPGHAYILADIPGRGIRIVPVGLAGCPLERRNYDVAVVNGYDAAVADLHVINPRGRLTIIDGPPGTGKTYIIRGLMHDVPKSKFVVVPPMLLKELSNPGMVLSLVGEMDNEGPLVLILEDADECLSTRKAVDMSSISAILNMSDGITGSLLDIRVVATTNSPVHEFDSALLRPGRLSTRIEVGPLSPDDFKNVVTRLLPSIDSPTAGLSNKELTLARAYDVAKCRP